MTSRSSITGYRNIAASWEKLIGLYAGECQRRGDLVRDQIATEKSIRTFLARFQHLSQPEDITAFEVRDWQKARMLKGSRQQLKAEAARLADFWYYLVWVQRYALVNVFLEALEPSRWIPSKASAQKSPDAPSNIPVGSVTSSVDPKAQTPP